MTMKLMSVLIKPFHVCEGEEIWVKLWVNSVRFKFLAGQ